MWYILFENPRTTAKYLKLYARVCVFREWCGTPFQKGE